MRAAPRGTKGRQIAKKISAVPEFKLALMPSLSSGTKRNTQTKAVRLKASEMHM